MAIDENASSFTGNHEDNLETMIAGIDPRVAEALPRIGIHRLADLAESTPGELFKALRVWAFSASTLKSRTGLVRPSKSWLSGK